MVQQAGYSKTPLIKKLGIKPGFKLRLHQVPDHYFDLLGSLPEHTEISSDPAEQVDFLHLFFTDTSDFIKASGPFKNLLKKEGMFWISWPKGKSSIQTDLNRELIREHMLSIGLVDVKVAAIDEDWSGLKFVYRLIDR